MIEHIIVQMENESGMDRLSALAKIRFTFIDKVCKSTVVKPRESKEHLRSQKNRQNPYRKIYSNSCFCSNNGIDFLVNIWCYRKQTSGTYGYGNKLFK